MRGNEGIGKEEHSSEQQPVEDPWKLGDKTEKTASEYSGSRLERKAGNSLA